MPRTPSTHRPNRGVRVALTRRGYNRMCNAGIPARMWRTSDTIRFVYLLSIIVFIVGCLAFFILLLFTSPAHAGIGVVGPDGETMLVETPSTIPQEILLQVLGSVRRTKPSDLPELLEALEPQVKLAFVDSNANWDAYMRLHADGRIDGCLEIEADQRRGWEAIFVLLDAMKVLEPDHAPQKQDVAWVIRHLIRGERRYRQCWKENLLPAPKEDE